MRHSFASIGSDFGVTELTMAELLGHAKGTVTSKYIHSLETARTMAADTIYVYSRGPLDGIALKQTTSALDREARKRSRGS